MKATNIHRREFLATAGKCALAYSAGIGVNDASAQPPAGLTNIAAFVLNTRYDALPPKALEWSKTAILDCLGVAVAGRNEESSRICADLARQEKAKEEATIYGHGFKSSAVQ